MKALALNSQKDCHVERAKHLWSIFVRHHSNLIRDGKPGLAELRPLRCSFAPLRMTIRDCLQLHPYPRHPRHPWSV